jgi:chloride channel protein, CIC family
MSSDSGKTGNGVDPVTLEARAHIREQIYARRSDVKRILYISFLSVVNAVIVGIIAKVLILLINFFTNIAFFGHISFEEVSPATNTLGLFVVVVPVLGGLIVGVMARFGSPAIRGHGIPEAMEKIITSGSKIHPLITILKPLSAAISIGTGGPFGAEGPIISTGGALGSFCGQTLHITDQERKILLAAGATAGMTAVFGTPFAAILLAIELLLFEFSAKSFLPVMLACITGACMHVVLFSALPTFPMPQIINVDSNAVFSYAMIGLVIGLVSVGVTKAVYFVEDLFEKLPVHWMWWPALGGLAVGIIGTFAPRTLGVGYSNITEALTGSLPLSILVSLCLWKFISWAISLGSGTSGGTLAPLLTIGSATGCLLGYLAQEYFPASHVVAPLAALVGMAAMFAGASRAILTSIVFAMETTMQESTLLPLIAGCSTSYLVSFILMRTTIMTEKIKRRGIQLPEYYRPDVLSLNNVSDVFKEYNDRFVYANTQDLAGTVKDIMGVQGCDYAIILNGDAQVMGTLRKSQFVAAANTDPIGSLLTADDSGFVYSDQSLENALELMLKTGRTALPVVNKTSHHAEGLITEWDILKVFEKRFMEDKKITQHVSLRNNALSLMKKMSRSK